MQSRAHCYCELTKRDTRSQEQQQLDTLACKDQARLEANTAGRQVGAFVLGLTIVGVPIAFELEKAKQREVYKSCMESRGYRVLPPHDGAASAASNSDPANAPSPARVIEGSQPLPSAVSSPVTKSSPNVAAKDEAVQLQKLKDLREKGLITEDEYERKRKDILDRL